MRELINQKTGNSKSISRLQMSHFFVVANNWCAHELRKRAWPQGTNTILALGLAQQISQKLSDDDEAIDSTTVQAYTGSSVTVTQPFYYSSTRRIQALVVTRSFPYSTFPIIGFYTTFPVLDVSNERHYLHFYSNIPLLNISITRRFPTIQHIIRTDSSNLLHIISK